MDHNLELIIPNPEHIWKYDFYKLLGILDILEFEVFDILHNPGNIGNWIFPILPYPGNIENMISIFCHFSKKDARQISRKMHRSMSRDHSSETDSGPNTKTVQSANLCSVYCVLYICRKSFDSIDS